MTVANAPHSGLVVFAFALAITVVAFVYGANYLNFLQFSQDFNPVHFAKLYVHNDMPSLDDSEVGTNARTYGLVSMYFWLAVVAEAIWTDGAYVVYALYTLASVPFFAFAFFCLGRAYIGSALGGIAFVGMIAAMDAAIYRLNLGYGFSLFNFAYVNDFTLAFGALSLASMMQTRYVATGLLLMVALILNPTIAVHFLCISLGTVILRELMTQRQIPIRPVLAILIPAAIGIIGALVQVKLAVPHPNPIDAEIRAIAIRTYGHSSIHYGGLLPYIRTMVSLLLAFCLYSLYLRKQDSAPAGWRGGQPLAWTVVVGLILMPGIWYWLSYTYTPALFITTGPSKFLLAAVVLAALVLTDVVFRTIKDFPALSVLVFVGALIVIFAIPYINARAGAYRVLPFVVFSGLVLSFATSRNWRVVILLQSIEQALTSFISDTERLQAIAKTIIAGALAATFVVGAAMPLIDGRLDYAQEFRSFKRELTQHLDGESILVPYTAPGSTHSRFGAFKSVVLRTDTRAGAILFWSVGRNAYFNDRLRHENEERVFRAANLPTWKEALSDHRREWEKAPRQYLTGASKQNGRVSFTQPKVFELVRERRQALQKRLADYSWPDFQAFACRIGGTHVVYFKDVAQSAPANALIEAPQFVLYPACTDA
ncbi:MAG: hypothetical protein GKR94_04460 [Gammaproteobacteria bacterium]|nr:hypothetical protein [Gammaproteobacteria bacterium]